MELFLFAHLDEATRIRATIPLIKDHLIELAVILALIAGFPAIFAWLTRNNNKAYEKDSE